MVHQGLAVYGNKGSTDQHAYVQQLRDGLKNFFVTFVEVLADYTHSVTSPSHLEVESSVTSGDYLSGFYQGTRRALYEGGRDSISITIDSLTARTLGALIALYDRTVGLYATMINVNAYHQPGVEAGKKAAARIIELQGATLKALAEANAPLTAQEISDTIAASAETENVYKILEHLSANPSRNIVREGSHPAESRFFSLSP